VRPPPCCWLACSRNRPFGRVRCRPKVIGLHRPPWTRPVGRVAPTNSSAQPVELEWWRGFKDPLLDRLIEWRSPRTRTCVLPPHAARGPSLRQEGGFGIGADRKRGWRVQERSEQHRASTGRRAGATRVPALRRRLLTPPWELDFFGRVRRSIQASTAEVEAAEAAGGTSPSAWWPRWRETTLSCVEPKMSSRWPGRMRPTSARPWN